MNPLSRAMRRVAKEEQKAAGRINAETVHDLRVAIRKCRSVAEGWNACRSHKRFKKIRRKPHGLFKALGKLRDAQVARLWMNRLVPGKGRHAKRRLLKELEKQEKKDQKKARKSLKRFDAKKWQKLIGELEAGGLTPPSAAERRAYARACLEEAWRLHETAIRLQSDIAYHELRVAFKKFRYFAANFLPGRYSRWKADLKTIHDALGNAHDLHELALWIAAEARVTKRRHLTAWSERIARRRKRELAHYHRLMTGPKTPWAAWRRSLG